MRNQEYKEGEIATIKNKRIIYSISKEKVQYISGTK